MPKQVPCWLAVLLLTGCPEPEPLACDDRVEPRLEITETGEPFVIEHLEYRPSQEPPLLRYQAELAKIGIDFQIRIVDTAQYVTRIRSFDFDSMITISAPVAPSCSAFTLLESMRERFQGGPLLMMPPPAAQQ